MNGGIVGLHHAAVNIRDWDVSLAFYRDVLGLELLGFGEASGHQMDQATGYENVRLRWAIFRVGSAHFEMIQYAQPPPADVASARYDAGATHIAFKAEDVDVAFQDLSRRGVRFLGEPVRFEEPGPVGAAFAYALDPNDVLLEFMEDVAETRRPVNRSLERSRKEGQRMTPDRSSPRHRRCVAPRHRMQIDHGAAACKATIRLDDHTPQGLVSSSLAVARDRRLEQPSWPTVGDAEVECRGAVASSDSRAIRLVRKTLLGVFA